MYIKIKYLIFLLLVFLLIVLLFKNCNKNLNNDLAFATDNFEGKKYEFVVETNKLGNEIYKQKQVIATQKQAINSGLLNEEQLKANNIKLVDAYVELNEQFELLNVAGTYTDSVIVINIIDSITKDNVNYLKIPQRFEVKELPFYSIQGTINKENVLLDNICVNSYPKIMIGTQKQGFFKKAIPVVIYKNSNPYIKVLDMQNVVILEDKKFYQKNGFWFLFGAFTATILLVKI